MKQAIIFSMDGLMVNCTNLHNNVWDTVLGIHRHTYSQVPADMKATFPGMRTIDICHLVVDQLSLEVEPEVLCAERDNEFLARIKDGVEPLPNLIQMLTRFKKAGFRMAVASSGSKGYIEHVVKQLLLQAYFSTFVSGDDMKRGKPSPEIYIAAAKELKVDTQNCIVIEDSPNGIAAAKGAGCYCIAVEHGKMKSLADADRVIKDLDELDPVELKAL
jgi:beta-phosphoglucomutase